MSQSIQFDRYPKFVEDQVLTEKCLNNMFGYLEEQQRLSRSTLIGIGIMCGMDVKLNNDKTALTITEGVGVTSKGYLIPFPETTYTFYTGFDVDQEIKYQPFLNVGTQKGKFSLLLPEDVKVDGRKPIKADFLSDKAVIVFVELLKIDNKNCQPDSCDDKGSRIEVTHRPLLVNLKDLDKLIFGGDKEKPFKHEAACVEWPEIKLPRYNVPSTYLLSSESVLKNFLSILNEDFIFNIEKVLSAAYNSLGYYIKDEFPTNPFPGLRNKFKFLFDGSISTQQLLYTQYYYDFFSDLIEAYLELRTLCNECLAICSPDEKLFPRHLILGNAIPSADEFRHFWIKSPAFSSNCCSEGKIKFLLTRIALLLNKLNIPKAIFSHTKKRIDVRITPSKYGNNPLSDKAIPYYYDVHNIPNPLYNNWNHQKSKLKKGDTNLSYYAEEYNSNPYVKDPLNFDIEPYNFFRVEGHIGMNWKTALSQVQKIKNTKRLPIDVVALNGDIFELVRSLASKANSLSEIVDGNKEIANELRCYFADIESQYDSHAAELRCSIIKVMAYFYNLKVIGSKENIASTGKLPISNLVRTAFPNYQTFSNTYGEQFDKYYITVKDSAYITPQALLFSSTFESRMGMTHSPANMLNPVYLMYYLEKIHEALVDGLVDLNISDLTQRIQDATIVSTAILQALDLIADFDMPALLEESLDAVIRFCKAQVFTVLYRNFLVNYALFISNQSFAMYALRNSGIQHKAGVTMGGTFILVYADKNERKRGIFDVASRLISGTVNDGAEEVADIGSNFDLSEARTHLSSPGDLIADAKKHIIKDVNRNPIMEMRTRKSIKGIGLSAIFDLVDKQKDDRILSDKELTELVDQFPDGTVIADFFVPNMAKASCMPMNFMVIGNDEDEVPKEIKLDIRPKEFCEDDKEGKYEITAKPEGGILKVDGKVVTENIFKPAAFSAGNKDSREVVISYELEGDVKNLRVKVYHKPEVKISIDSIDHANHLVKFKNETKFAGKYIWDFGEGHFSELENPGSVSFKDRASARVVLTAFNGPCKQESDPLPVRFEDGPNEVRTCIPINIISTQLKRIDKAGTDDFKKLIPKYDLLKSIFIGKIVEIAKLSQKEQFKLLVSDLSISVIQAIIRSLNSIIKSDNKEFRGLALMLNDAMMRLIFFYSCCQDEDIDKAKVSTHKILSMELLMVNSWARLRDFTAQEKKIIEDMSISVKNELEKTAAETPNKVIYIDLLKKLAQAI